MNEIDKKRVLIVDDNPYILKILATMLKLENLEITTAKNGEDALHLIINETEGKFDIIVTDYQMPIINGQELADTLRSYDEYCHTPIILVTQATHIRYENDDKYKVFNKILYKPIRGMTINGTKSYAKGIALVFSLIFRRNCINLANQLIQGVIIKLLMPHSSIL